MAMTGVRSSLPDREAVRNGTGERCRICANTEYVGPDSDFTLSGAGTDGMRTDGA